MADQKQPTHAKHYELFEGVEAKDVLEVLAGSYICDDMTAWESWCFLTMMKYRLRIGKKDDPSQELKKIADYTAMLDRLEDSLNAENER